MNYAPLRWFEEMEKRTAGRIKITPYYSELFGRAPETLTILKTGICDIALVFPNLFPSVCQISDIVALPFFVPKRYVGAEGFRTIL